MSKHINPEYSFQTIPFKTAMFNAAVLAFIGEAFTEDCRIYANDYFMFIICGNVAFEIPTDMY